MHYRRTPIEMESPEQLGYAAIRNNLAESSVSDMRLADYGIEADVGQVLLPYGDPLPMAATLSPRVIGVSSMSKTYGLPGLRIGWLTSQDEEHMETFLAAKEQIFISGAVLDEELAARVLARRNTILPFLHETVREHLATVREWLEAGETFEWVEPRAGVVCFPRIRSDVDVDRFYRTLLDDYGTYVGPGHWFDQDRRHFRLGFAWPTHAELVRGLESLELAAADTRRAPTRSSRSVA